VTNKKEWLVNHMEIVDANKISLEKDCDNECMINGIPVDADRLDDSRGKYRERYKKISTGNVRIPIRCERCNVFIRNYVKSYQLVYIQKAPIPKEHCRACALWLEYQEKLDDITDDFGQELSQEGKDLFYQFAEEFFNWIRFYDAITDGGYKLSFTVTDDETVIMNYNFRRKNTSLKTLTVVGKCYPYDIHILYKLVHELWIRLNKEEVKY